MFILRFFYPAAIRIYDKNKYLYHFALLELYSYIAIQTFKAKHNWHFFWRLIPCPVRCNPMWSVFLFLSQFEIVVAISWTSLLVCLRFTLNRTIWILWSSTSLKVWNDSFLNQFVALKEKTESHWMYLSVRKLWVLFCSNSLAVISDM